MSNDWKLTAFALVDGDFRETITILNESDKAVWQSAHALMALEGTNYDVINLAPPRDHKECLAEWHKLEDGWLLVYDPNEEFGNDATFDEDWEDE
jgi:hypothetical protein